MNLAYFILAIIVLGIEPIIFGALFDTVATPTLLTYGGIANVAIIILFGVMFQVMKKTGNKNDTNVSNSTASFLFFPAYVFLTLTVSFYFAVMPTAYGIIAMLGGALIFFTILVLGYSAIHKNGVYWGQRKIMPKDYVLWIAIVIASVVFFFLPELGLYLKITIALWTVVLSMIFFIRGMKLIKSASVFKMWSTKFFLLAAIGFTIFSGVQYYASINDNSSIQDDLSATITGMVEEVLSGSDVSMEETITTTGDTVLNITGEVVSTTGENTVSSGDITDPTELGSDITIVEEDAIDIPDTVVTGEVTPEITATGPLSYFDVIPYLVKKNDLKALSASNARFLSLSQSNEFYQYFNIALQYKMIGKNINPGQQVSCDTYLVLKGLSEGRTINQVGTIFDNYRAAGAAQNKLNGCTQGSIVTDQTL